MLLNLEEKKDERVLNQINVGVISSVVDPLLLLLLLLMQRNTLIMSRCRRSVYNPVCDLDNQILKYTQCVYSFFSPFPIKSQVGKEEEQVQEQETTCSFF